MKKIFFFAIFFYFLTLLEVSFFPALFNEPVPFIFLLTFLFVIIFNYRERQKDQDGILSALAGGFFLDIFSTTFFGFWIIILTALSLFIKFIFKRYVLI